MIRRNVVNLCGWWARNRPDEIAIWFEGRTRTWSELHGRTASLAAALGSLGVGVGDRVGILSENSAEWLEAGVAVLKAGAVVVPVNTRLSADELAYVADHAGIRALFHSEATAPLAESLADRDVARVVLGSPRYEELASGEGDLDAWLEVGETDTAVIGYTSGTTGRPKGVVLSHAAIHWLLAVRQLEEPTFTSEVRSMSIQPLFFTACFVLHFLPTFMAGGRFYSMDGLKAGYLLDTLEQERINNLWAIPLVYADVAAQPRFDDADLGALVSLCTGGTRVPVPVLERWHAKGISLRQGYGSTETGGVVTFATRDEALAHPERAGAPLPGVRIGILGDDDVERGPGEEGELVVKSPGMLTEYFRSPEETAAAFTKDGWFRTGDMAALHEDGTISIVGRTKDMVISGGVNIYPAEIERVIAEVPGVEDVAVVAGLHRRWDEVPVAIVRGAGVDEASVIDHCRTKLQKFAVPKGVIVVDAPFPTTASGKTHKPTLREQHADRLRSDWVDA